MTGLEHRTVHANGIDIHFVSAGSGPVVLLCHGFPESWYSWRHQIRALAAAGYRVIAPDMRGYGQTDSPPEIGQYTIFHLVGDLVGLLDALDLRQVAIIGHDWGAVVAWTAALFRPDRFSAVAALSVPFRPRSSRPPLKFAPSTEDLIFYQTYFLQPGVAEAELEIDTSRTIAATLLALSGDMATQRPELQMMVPRGGGWLTDKPVRTPLPDWLSEADIAFYAREFDRNGFRGPLNWYRNIDRNWELMAPWQDAIVTVPALFMIGERDLVLAFKGTEETIADQPSRIPHLTVSTIVPGCGHWIQQERADEVNAALIDFLRMNVCSISETEL